MEKTKKFIFWTIVVSESSHIFCCVLPTIFSLLGLLGTFGVTIVIPGVVTDLHDALHEYELPMILFSAFMLALGWAAYHYSRRIDCHDTGCHHGACEPRKDRSFLIMCIATGLLVVNTFVYFVIHRGMGISVSNTPHHHEHVIDEDHDHDHNHHGHEH